MALRVTLIQGGGTGLDQVPAVLSILRAAGAAIEWDEHLAGWASMERGGAAIPETLLRSVRDTGLVLKTKLLPPPGPAMPVIEITISTLALPRAPRAMASAVSRLTAPCFSIVAAGTPSICCLASFE